MTASELRIGNFFIEENSGEIIKAIGLEEKRIVFSGMLLDKWQAKPIPLTEEILLKCGFVLGMKMQSFVKGKYCFVDKKDGFLYGEFSEEGIFYFNSRTKIKHLHQLQNLYFALTGKELTINL